MRTPGPSYEAPPRDLWQLVVDPSFGLFFAGKFIAMAGIWVYSIAAAIVVYDLTGSTLMVGLVGVAQFGPNLVLTPWSGARADQGDRRRQFLLGRVIASIGPGALAVWALVAGLEGMAGAWATIMGGLVMGIGISISSPAMHTIVPALVRPSELPPAIALDNATFTIGRAVGPAFGALAATTLHPAVAFAVAGGSSLLFTGAVVFVRLRPDERTADRDSSVRAGFRYMRGEPQMVALLLGVGAMGIGIDPVVTLTPALSDGLAGGDGLVGVMASSFGIGTGVGYLTLQAVRERLGLDGLARAGLLLLGGAMAALVVVPGPILAVAVLGAGGIGMTYGVVGLSTLIQVRVPEDLRGRVMAMWTLAFLGARPLAAAVSGAVADMVSLDAALAWTAAVVLGASVLARPSKIGAEARPR